VKKNFCFKN